MRPDWLLWNSWWKSVPKPKEGVPVVIELLKINDDGIRIQAARMLSKFGREAGPAAPALVVLLADKSPQVRTEATNAAPENNSHWQ